MNHLPASNADVKTQDDTIFFLRKATMFDVWS